MYGILVGVAAVLGAVAFVLVVCVVVARMVDADDTIPRHLDYSNRWIEWNPPGSLGKLRCYHCDCGGRVATPLELVPTAAHPVCPCGLPVHGRRLRVTIEDHARFMEEVWGVSR